MTESNWIYCLKSSITKAWCFVAPIRNFNFLVSLGNSLWRIMDSSKEWFINVSSYRAVEISSITLKALSPGRIDSGILKSSFWNNLRVLAIVISHSLMKSLLIVISHVLHFSPSDSIMMLIHSHSIKHLLLGLNVWIQLIWLYRLIKSLKGIELARCNQTCLANSNLSLWVRSWGEIACPVVIWTIPIRH